MQSFFGFLLLCSCCTSCVSAQVVETENIPPIPTSIAKKFDRYLNFYNAELMDWTPNGRALILRGDQDETQQVYQLSKAESKPVALTQLKHTPASIKAGNSTNNGFTYRKKGAAAQYFYYNLTTKTTWPITDTSEAAWGNAIGHKKGVFAYASKKRNGTDFDIYINQLAHPGKTKMVLQREGFWMPIAFSSDDRLLLLGQFINFTYNHFYILNLETKELVQITPENEKKWHGYSALFGPDDQSVYYANNQLYTYHLKEKTTRCISKDQSGIVGKFDINTNSNSLVYSTFGDSTRLILHSLKKGELERVILATKKEISNLKLHPNETQIAIGFSSPIHPNHIAIYNIDKAQLQEWTLPKKQEKNSVIWPQKITYPTFDSTNNVPRQIEAVYYRPKVNGKHPVYIEIHGGLNYRSSAYFDPFKQYLTDELNMAVLMPNFRGSSGYGPEFMDLDNGLGKANVFKDIEKLLDWIKTQPELDENNIIISGTSQGGRIAMSVLSEYNNRFIGGIGGAGIYNIPASLSHVSENEKALLKTEFGDFENNDVVDFLSNISPINNTEKVKTPIMLYHGQSDQVVDVKQTLNYKDSLSLLNQHVWLLILNGEGHHQWNRKNERYLNLAKICFINTLLQKNK